MLSSALIFGFFVNFVSCQQVFKPGGLETTCCENYCFGTDSDPQQVQQFSTKTPYEFAREKNDQKYYNIPSKI